MFVTFVQQGFIKLIAVKQFLMLQKISILDRCCCFELSIHKRILKSVFQQFQTKNISFQQKH